MAIARDGIAVTTNTNNVGESISETFSHEIDADTDLLVVCVGNYDGDGNLYVDDVTYNGVSLTLISNTQQVSNDDSRTQIWYMKATDLPSPGTYDVVVSMASGTSELQSIVSGYQGVDQSTTVRDSDGDVVANDTSLAVPTLTTVSGDWAIGVLGKWNGASEPTSNGTRLGWINNGENNDSCEASYLAADDTTTDLGWTWDTIESPACGGAAFIPDTGSSGEADPGLCEIALTGFEPTTATTAHVSAAPDVSQIILTGYEPTVLISDHQEATPGVGEIVITGFEPTAVATAHVAAEPGVSEVVLTGFEPTAVVTEYVFAEPGVSEIIITGYEPTVLATAHVAAEPGLCEIVITGFEPIATTTTGVSAFPGTCEIVITGYAPTVFASEIEKAPSRYFRERVRGGG